VATLTTLLTPTGHLQAATSVNATWLVTNVHGSVTAQRGADPVIAVSTGDRIPAGMRIVSKARGHITLMRDGDIVQVDANSVIDLVATDWGTPAKSVIQTIGSARYKVTSDPSKPFKVRTPFLTAAAVGTAFTVSVDQNSANVKVTKGAVEVWSVLSGETSMLVAGQVAEASIAAMIEARDAETARQARAVAAGPSSPAQAARPAAAAPPVQSAEVPAGFEDAPVLPDDVPPPAARHDGVDATGTVTVTPDAITSDAITSDAGAAATTNGTTAASPPGMEAHGTSPVDFGSGNAGGFDSGENVERTE
jgi:hypothetical protein